MSLGSKVSGTGLRLFEGEELSLLGVPSEPKMRVAEGCDTSMQYPSS